MQRQKRGFTLIELAIVIVIAGILAAIAVPIYQTLVERAKWSEAAGIASTVRSSLDVFYSQNNGWTRETSAGSVTVGDSNFATFGPIIGLEASDFGNMRYFHTDAISIEDVDETADGTPEYVIIIDGNHASNPAGAPEGTYTLTSDGFDDIDN